jgi:hypothetical protein
MKTIIKNLALLVLACVLFSCEHDLGYQGTVSFTFNPVESGSSTLKAAAVAGTPTKMVFNVVDAKQGGDPIQKEVSIYLLGGSYVSEPLALPASSYLLKEFLVLDESGKVMYLSPKEGSSKAYLVKDPLDIAFDVKVEEMTTLSPEVIGDEDATPADFGYTVFDLNIVKTFDMQIVVFENSGKSGNNHIVKASLDVTFADNSKVRLELDEKTNVIKLPSGKGPYKFDVIRQNCDAWSRTYTEDELSKYLVSNGYSPLVVNLSKNL